ncbi:hypothetical protein [Streptomyces sp. NPDC047315]|uniref:hypothetical protein n=1 Tax=Streptomyces sp. NPDC047315 TaxID=3155142 RepID=UPI0033F5C6C0
MTIAITRSAWLTTRHLYGALRERGLHDLPRHTNNDAHKWEVTMLIQAHAATHDAFDGDTWYDVTWAVPTVVDYGGPNGDVYGWHSYAPVTTLGEPPTHPDPNHPTTTAFETYEGLHGHRGYYRDARFDWGAYADSILQLHNTSRPPVIDEDARIRYGAYRLNKAEVELESAKQSVKAVLRNVRQARMAAGTWQHGTKVEWAGWYDVSRPTLDDWLNR